MSKKTLYVSDLDGTLLGTDSRVSEKSASIVSELSRRGALITVATARTPATVVPLLKGIYTTPPAIVMTGCAMWDRSRECFFDTHFLPEIDVVRALDICSRYGVHPFVYTMAPEGNRLEVYHAPAKMNKAEESFYLERSRLALKRFHLGTPPPDRARTDSMLFYAMGTSDNIVSAYREIMDDTDCSVCCYPDIFNPSVHNLEIFPPGVSKAAAIRRLAAATEAERIVVFGDSLNDLPMLGIADLGVAVENALPEVKEAADIVIGPNYTDSVARFIEEDFGM